jgi:hypothetical protein
MLAGQACFGPPSSGALRGLNVSHCCRTASLCRARILPRGPLVGPHSVGTPDPRLRRLGVTFSASPGLLVAPPKHQTDPAALEPENIISGPLC